MKKCPRCNGCMEDRYKDNKHFYYCWFCKIYVDHEGNVYNEHWQKYGDGESK